MNTTKYLKPGQRVTIFGSWDDCGTFYYERAKVVSNNGSQARFEFESGTKSSIPWRPWADTLESFSPGANKVYAFVGMDDDAAYATCLKLANLFVQSKRAECERCIRDNYFARAAAEDLKKLHEPEVRTPSTI